MSEVTWSFSFFPTQTHPHPLPCSPSSLFFNCFTHCGQSAPSGYCSSIKLRTSVFFLLFLLSPQCSRARRKIHRLILFIYLFWTFMHIFGASVGELGPHIHGRHSPTEHFVPGNFNTEQQLPFFSFLPFSSSFVRGRRGGARASIKV